MNLWCKRYGKPKQVQSDNAGENKAEEAEDFLIKKGTTARPTEPYSHQTMGHAENSMRILASDIRAILLEAGLPASYWNYAATHAIYLRNIKPRADKSSSYEEFHGKKPKIGYRTRFDGRAFGCLS